MTSIEVDIWIRDTETDEVVEKIRSMYIHIKTGQKLEIWVRDQLKYEEEAIANEEI